MTHITRLPAPSADAISPDRPQWSGRSFVEKAMSIERAIVIGILVLLFLFVASRVL